MVKRVDETDFMSVLQAGRPVMVDFWAPWCNPCRMLGPVIEELSEDYGSKVLVCKCNVDDNQSLASEMGISSIPAVVFFKDGRPVDVSVGLVPKEVLVEKLEALLK